MNTLLPFEYALNAQSILWETGRRSRVVGSGDPPVVPIEQNGYLIEVLEPDVESTMPAEIRTRLDLLIDNGVNYSCILIAHEIDQRQPPRLEIPKKVISIVSAVLPILGTILCAVVSVLAAVVMVLFQLMLFMFTLDPLVIVVLDDPQKTWLEVAKWYE